MRPVWPDSFVEESNLAFHVSQLRKLLSDDSKDSQYIQTVPRRGYRFIAEIGHHTSEPTALIPEGHAETMLLALREAGQVAVEDAGRDAVAIEPRAGSSVAKRTGVLALLAIAVIVLAVAGYLSFARKRQPEQPAPLRSMAVLPFKVLNPGSNDEYLGIGMTDVLITRLSNLRQLIVRPTSAMLPFANSPKDSVAVGEDLRSMPCWRAASSSSATVRA